MFQVLKIHPVGGIRLREPNNVLFDTDDVYERKGVRRADVFMNYYSWALTSSVSKVHGVDSNVHGNGSIPAGYDKTVTAIRVFLIPLPGKALPRKPVDVEVLVGVRTASWKQHHGKFHVLNDPLDVVACARLEVVVKNLPSTVARVRVELHGPLARPAN